MIWYQITILFHCTDTSSKTQKCGSGIAKYANGDRYVGEFEHGLVSKRASLNIHDFKKSLAEARPGSYAMEERNHI